jgi:4-hydroxy-tetrahydrodipicolinate synthase
MFHGSMVAMITPMGEDGSLDDAALRALVEFHIRQGSDAIVAVGTTGESATLDEEEHCDVIKRVVDYAGGRLPVIAGTGANSTREAITLTRCAMESGADACLLVTPYYNKPTQEGLYLHHKAVAEAVDIPQILYNVPGRTACDMLPETIARLSEVPNIIGVKEATGDLSRLDRLREMCDASFRLFSGDDATGCDFLLQGGHGVISVTANVAPRLMHEMTVAALAGRDREAREIDAKLSALHSALFVESNPIPVKWAMMKLGLAGRGIRLPLTWLSPSAEEEVERAMRQADVL